MNGVREREPVAVPCPQQNVDYSETFHFIDKGNGTEAKYELGGQSRSSGWTPKLSCRMFNMNFNNSYRIYLSLMEKHNPGRRLVKMTEGIKEATHALIQRGSKMWTRAPDHPSPVRVLRNVHDTGCGKRKKSDAKRVTIRSMARAPLVEVVSSMLYKLRNQQNKHPWRKHQSVHQQR